MKEKINEIMKTLETIEYGFKDETGFNIIENTNKWEKDFNDFYYLLTPDELFAKRCGVCWDQVEAQRYLFNKIGMKTKTFFICIYDNDNIPSHTFLTYFLNKKYYWFEHSWNQYKGIHEYNSLKSLLRDVKEKFINSQKNINSDYTFVYQYKKPKKHITCNEFYQYVERQKLIKLNKPLYFYHLVCKNADMSKGLLSLQYMYENALDDLFLKSVSKYHDRIVGAWGIPKYKGKTTLTKKEYIDGLNIFRGTYGASYIYFFRYPPKKVLGENMANILKYKDIYRININDEELQKQIADIFWGYDMSHSDNKVLNKYYYENITPKEYFKKYNDNDEMIFKNINHIGIAFNNNYCDIKYLTKITK